MSEAPKKIWIDELFEAHEEKILANDVLYIREDVVLKLVEALEGFLNATGMPDRIRAAQLANVALVSYRGYSNDTDKECNRLFSVIDDALESDEIGRGME